MKITSFEIEESKVNTQQKVLIAIAEDGSKWVVSGDHWNPTYVQPYEKAFDTKTEA